MKDLMCNDKISNRQIQRLLVFDLMGIATLLLPPYLAKLCGASGIYAIGIGCLLAFVYLLYLGVILTGMKKDMMGFLKTTIPPGIRTVVIAWVLFHCVFVAGFCAYVFANLMEYSLVKDTAYEMILFLITLTALYGVWGGMERRARVYEVLFWFILVPYLVMMLLSVRDFEFAYVKPLFSIVGNHLGKGSYLVFLMFTPLYFVLFLVGKKEKPYGNAIIKTAAGALFISSSILLVSFLLLLGNFGAESMANLRFPVITLMSSIQFEGYFLKRMDALMLAVWFFTLYALLNLHLHYGVRMLDEVGVQKEKKGVWNRLIPALGMYGVALCMHTNSTWLNGFLFYYSYVAVPCMIVGPLLLLAIGKKGEMRHERSE